MKKQNNKCRYNYSLNLATNQEPKLKESLLNTQKIEKRKAPIPNFKHRAQTPKDPSLSREPKPKEPALIKKKTKPAIPEQSPPHKPKLAKRGSKITNPVLKARKQIEKEDGLDGSQIFSEEAK